MMPDVTIKHSNIPDRIYDLHKSREDGFGRPHLGASLIGSECDRYIWLVFRWGLPPEFPGRVLRLFKRGFMEEKVLINELNQIGIKAIDIDPETDEQWRFEQLNGHFAGSMDGRATGVPEAPKTEHLLEFKTSNDRQYKNLVRKGIEEAKPQHYVQMQIYMKVFKLKRGLYIVVNKNDDSIYTERIAYNAKVAKYYIELAKKIITSPNPPEIGLTPKCITCKWCDFKEVCHGDRVPQATCRTCANATPQIKNGEEPWVCEKYDNAPLDLDAQRAGGECPSHVFIPAILPQCYTVIDAGETWVKYKTSEGEELYNGCQDILNKPNVYSSKEMERLKPGQYTAVSMVKDTFDGACLVSDSRGLQFVHDPDEKVPF